MNNYGKLSVIIPTYNRADTIERAIRSVLNQDYPDIEVIIVDDCSTDQTKRIINEMQDERIKYYCLKQNSGACVARNYGISIANGDYIAFHDSDDIWLANKLNKQFSYLIEKDADLVFCALKRSDVDTGKEWIKPSYNIHASNIPVKMQILRENCISTQCILAKKKVFDDIKFDEKLRRFQDWDIAIRIAGKYHIEFLSEPLVECFFQSNSISKTVSHAESLNVLYEKYKEIILKNDGLKKWYYKALANGYFREKKYKKSKEFYSCFLKDVSDIKILIKYVLACFLVLFEKQNKY